MCKVTQLVILVLATGVCILGCSENRGNGLTTAREPSYSTTQDADSDSGILFGYVTPTDPRYAITLSEIQEHARNNTATFIDARGPAAYALGHVRGAINMPAGAKQASLSKVRETVAPDQLVIIYCSGPYCDSSDMIYEYLASQGYNNLRIYKPGWQGLSKVSELR